MSSFGFRQSLHVVGLRGAGQNPRESDEDPESVFVITAYEPRGKAKQAFRRRQRRKPK